jgi:plastocyanin
VIPGAGPGGSGSSPGSSAGSGTPSPTEPPVAPAGPAHVQVTAEDTSGYHFILSRTSVPAGPVVIEFVNHGQDEHNLHAVEPAEGTEAGGLKENVKPDARTDLTLNLHAGSYTLFCSLPGHEAKGMKATLAVE